MLVCHLSPGILDERMHLFAGTGLTPGAAAREPGEQIENLVTPWEQALRWIEEGETLEFAGVMLAFGLLVTTALILASLAGAFLQYFGYELSVDGKRGSGLRRTGNRDGDGHRR